MPYDHRKQFIIDAFMAAASRRTSKEQRLRNGLYLRGQLQAILQQGRLPAHPRFEWLRRQARTMLELLLAMARDYDKSNPTASDRASLADLLDIVAMTQGHVNGILQAGLIDPDDVQLQPYEEVQPQLQLTPGAATTVTEPNLEDAIKDDGENDGEDE